MKQKHQFWVHIQCHTFIGVKKSKFSSNLACLWFIDQIAWKFRPFSINKCMWTQNWCFCFINSFFNRFLLGLEIGSGFGVRLHGRNEVGRANSAFRFVRGATHQRGRISTGSRQYHPWLRTDSGRCYRKGGFIKQVSLLDNTDINSLQ